MEMWVMDLIVYHDGGKIDDCPWDPAWEKERSDDGIIVSWGNVIDYFPIYGGPAVFLVPS